MMQQSLSAISLIYLVAMTSPTISMTSLWLDISILFGIFMALWTFSFSSLRNGTMPTRINSITDILLRGSPIKIGQAIIAGVVIFMTAPQSLRPGTNESLQHQRMNRDRSALPVTKQSAGVIPTTRLTASNQTLRKYPTPEPFCGVPITLNFAIQRSHSPLVRYLVARVIDHWLPFLFAGHPRSVTLSTHNTLGAD